MAEKHKVSYNTLIKRANAEKWATVRGETYNESTKKAQEKTSDARANNALKLERARAIAIERVISALEQLPDKSGTHLRRSYMDKEKGQQISVDYDLPALITALEKLSTGTAADIERQKQFAAENNSVLMSYADLFSRPARTRTLADIEGGDEDV